MWTERPSSSARAALCRYVPWLRGSVLQLNWSYGRFSEKFGNHVFTIFSGLKGNLTLCSRVKRKCMKMYAQPSLGCVNVVFTGSTLCLTSARLANCQFSIFVFCLWCVIFEGTVVLIQYTIHFPGQYSLVLKNSPHVTIIIIIIMKKRTI